MEQAQLTVPLPELDDTSEEDRRVLRWRLEQFLELGFGLVNAAMLADSDADLSAARRLVDRGCPPPTAARILL
jgi:hypothetical protein